jgi:hypothetical protein
MMLPIDIALIAEPAFRKWVEIYAKEEDKFFKVWCTAGSRHPRSINVPSTLTLPVLLFTVNVEGFCGCFWETFVVGSTQRNCQAVVSILVNSDPDPIST